MKKFILTLLAFGIAPFALAAEIECASGWRNELGCDQCFQFFLTEADIAFSSSDIFFPRGDVNGNEKEILWIDRSDIRGFAMQGAQLGPVGDLRNLFEFPHVDGNGPDGRYTTFGPGESKTWARMNAGTGIGVVNIPDDIRDDIPVYRLEYKTVSEVEDGGGNIIANSQVEHKECAMYFYLGLLSGDASIKITKDDDDNHDDHQRVILDDDHRANASGEVGVGGRASFWIEVENTGDMTLEDVYVRDEKAPDCTRAIGTLKPGERFDYTCRDNHVTRSYTNTAKVLARAGRNQNDIITDEDDTYVEVGEPAEPDACEVRVTPERGNAPFHTNIVCRCDDADRVRIDIGSQGDIIDSYDDMSATHVFHTEGTYDVMCIPDGRSDLVGRKTIFATKSCGNGTVESGEQCDDGNSASGDGCSSICQMEQCGNGRVDAGEQCDDGNNNNGDNCDNLCFTRMRPTGPEDLIYALFMISAAIATGFLIIRQKKHVS